MNTPEEYLARIQTLEKANQALQKELERSQKDRLKLEETNERKEFLLCKIIQDFNQAEQQLQSLILGTATTTGQNFFPVLVKHIAEALGVSYAVVTECVGDTLNILALWTNSAQLNASSYPFSQTPCEQVLQNGTFYCERSLQQEFPQATFLAELGAESYLGVALRDIQGRVMGNLCILDAQPIQHPQRAEEILRVFAARAATELERQQTCKLLEQLNQALEAKVEERTAELQASEARIRAIIDAIPDLLLRVTKDGFCLDYISACSQIGEFLPIRKHLSEVLPPELLQQQLCRIEQAIATGTLQVYEHQFCKRDRIVHEEVRIGAISADEVLIIVRDITDRKQTENALRDSEQRFRSAISNAPFPIMIHAEDSEVLQINETWTELTGYTHQDIPTTLMWAQRAYGGRAESILDNVIAKKYTLDSRWEEGEFTINTSSGHQRIWQFSSAPLGKLPDGRRIVVSMAVDVTERKQAEHALQQSQQFIQTVLDTVPIPVFWKGQNSVFLGCNQQLANVFGLESANEIAGKTDFDFSVTDTEANAYLVDDRTVMESGKARLGIEETLTTPDGEKRWLETHKAPLRDWAGNVIGIVGTFQDITDRKQAEIALRTKTEELDQFFSLALDLLCIANTDGYFVRLNSQWEKTLGYPLSELEGARFLNYVHPDDLENTLEVITQLQKGEEILDFVNRYLRQDGSYRWIEWRAVPSENFVYAAARDITDRKQAENHLRQLSARLNLAVESAGIGIWDWDITHDIVVWDEQMYELYGITSEQFANAYEAWLHSIHPDDRDMAQTISERARRGEIDYDTEFRVIHPDGTIHYIKANALVQHDSQGEPQRMIGINYDITELKRTETQVRSLLNRSQLLNRISSAIRNSLDLNIILQNSVNAIVAELPADICTFAWYRGSEHSNIWQVITEQKSPQLSSWIGSYDLDNFPKLLRHILQNQLYRVDQVATIDDSSLKKFLEGMDIEAYLCLPIHTASGKVGSLQIGRISSAKLWLDEEIELLRDIGNQVAIAIYQAHLYKESQAKTEELKQSYQNLKDAQLQLIQSEKMSSLGQLVAGIAHEINNPMSFIYGNLVLASDYANSLTKLISLYQEELPEPPQAIIDFVREADTDYILNDFPKLIKSMEAGTTRIQNIVQSLRTFSRLDQSDYKVVDIHENIDTTLVILQNRLNGRAGNPEIHVVKRYGELPLIECYSGLLNQVFMNLLVNAIDAIEERQVEAVADYSGCITITTETTLGNKVKVSIKDNGIGMSAETQARIFNPFFTTKPIGVGTGMGLSTSYQIVTGDHQGQLSCFSEQMVGTEFVIELWQSIRQFKET